MNAAFIAAVVDTLLPGDSGGRAGEPRLPPGSTAGIDLSALFDARGAVFEAIAKQAGGADAFIAGGEPRRIVAVQATERAMPEAFRALLSTLLADYYESTPVLSAMDWRAEPPQPRGHQLKLSDGATAQHLEHVRSRQKLWRG